MDATSSPRPSLGEGSGDHKLLVDVVKNAEGSGGNAERMDGMSGQVASRGANDHMVLRVREGD